MDMDIVQAKETVVSKISSQMDDIMNRLSRCDNTLYTAIDRLTGPIPATAETVQLREDADGFIPRLVSRLQSYEQLLGSIEGSIKRLNDVV